VFANVFAKMDVTITITTAIAKQKLVSSLALEVLTDNG